MRFRLLKSDAFPPPPLLQQLTSPKSLSRQRLSKPLNTCSEFGSRYLPASRCASSTATALAKSASGGEPALKQLPDMQKDWLPQLVIVLVWPLAALQEYVCWNTEHWPFASVLTHVESIW